MYQKPNEHSQFEIELSKYMYNIIYFSRFRRFSIFLILRFHVLAVSECKVSSSFGKSTSQNSLAGIWWEWRALWNLILGDTPLHISRTMSNGAAQRVNMNILLDRMSTRQFEKHEYDDEPKNTRKKAKTSIFAFQLINAKHQCLFEWIHANAEPNTNENEINDEFTWAVIPMVSRCRNLSYLNSVQFSWCRTAPAHLNNRFSAIQSTAHNYRLRCAHGLCLPRTNERIVGDVSACDSTFSDTAEWTISGGEMESSEWEKFDGKNANSKLEQIYKIAIKNDYANVTVSPHLSCSIQRTQCTWENTLLMFANFIIWIVCSFARCRVLVNGTKWVDGIPLALKVARSECKATLCAWMSVMLPEAIVM